MPAVTVNNQPRHTPYVLRFALYASLICLLTSCVVVRLTHPTVKIGLVGPFEGVYRYLGYDAIYAARLALREANAAGGVAGYSVQLVAYDDGGTVEGARLAARSLAQDREVVAVIGHFGAETTRAARAIYAEAGLPLVVAGTLEGQADEEPDLLCALTGYLARGRVTATAAPLQWQLFVARAPAWLGAAPACVEAWSAVVSEEVPPPPGVDAVWLPPDPVQAGATLLALREAGWRGPVGGGPALGSPLFARVAGTAATEVLFAAPYRWPLQEGADEAFSAAYQALGPHVPPPGPFALTTYQATQTLLTALETAVQQGHTPTRQNLAQNLAQPLATTTYLYHWTPAGTLEPISNPTPLRSGDYSP